MVSATPVPPHHKQTVAAARWCLWGFYCRQDKCPQTHSYERPLHSLPLGVRRPVGVPNVACGETVPLLPRGSPRLFLQIAELNVDFMPSATYVYLQHTSVSGVNTGHAPESLEPCGRAQAFCHLMFSLPL